MKAHKRFPDARGLTLSDRLVPPTMADIKTKTRRRPSDGYFAANPEAACPK
jgi:hypothetical protein